MWLVKFNNEFHKDAFKKNVEPLHNTPELKKDCGDRNNARNRDISSIFHMFSYVDSFPKDKETYHEEIETEEF